LGAAFVGSGTLGFAAKRAMAAPAVRSVPALATLRIEVKRFRLGADAVLIFIQVEFSGLMDLRREDYKTVISNQAFFC